MSDTADLAHEVLIRVAEFVKKLPAEQIGELVRGEARLEVIPRGHKVVAPGAVRTSRNSSGAMLPRPVDEIRSTVTGMGDRVAARRYLDADLKLTVPQLKTLAKALDITVTGTKPKILDGVVEWAVGRRLDSEAISRAGGGR